MTMASKTDDDRDTPPAAFRSGPRSRAAIWAYPWDVAGEGVERFVDTIRENGFQRVSVAAAYHSGLFVTPHHSRHRLYFPEGGALHFRPSEDTLGTLEGLGMKPRMSGLLEEGEFVRDLASAADRRSVRTSGWFVALHNTWLGTARPDVVQRTVYGDPLFYALCPANPLAVEYVVALLSDLTRNDDIDGIDMEALGYMGFPHDFHHEKDLVGLDAESSFLLSLCFCSSCTERGRREGIDVERARAVVRGRLDEVFQSEAALRRDDGGFRLLTGEEGDLAADPDLQAYLNMRNDVVMELWATVREAVGPNCALRLIEWEDPARWWTRGFDGRLNEVLDAVIMCCYSWEPELLPAMVEKTRRFLPRVPVIAGIQGGWPTCASEEDVKAQLGIVDSSCAAGLQVYNYGLMRRENLRWFRTGLKG